MKTLYLECGMGAAGDMLMAALSELLPDRQLFLDKMNSIGIPGVKVEAEKESFDTEVEIIIKLKSSSTTEKFVKKDKKNITRASELLNNILIVIFSPEATLTIPL